jgi:Heavy metal associated domain 2
MLEYIHFVPGRLRLKISEFRDRRRAAEAQSYVSAIPAVKSAVTNPITGSLTINFDHRELSIRDLWARLRAQGYVSTSCPQFIANGSLTIGNPGGNQFGRAVVTALFEALMQHSAQALVRALL